MATIRTFCTYKTAELSAGVFKIDVVLRRGVHDELISMYPFVFDSEVDTGNPDAAVLDCTGELPAIRLRSESEWMPELRTQKKAWLTQRMDEILSRGGMVLTSTQNFRMKTFPSDQQAMMVGLSSFKRQVAKNSLDPAMATALIRDYDNQYHACTIAEWEQAIADMEDHGVAVWTTKCQKQALCDAALTQAELDAVTWD